MAAYAGPCDKSGMRIGSWFMVAALVTSLAACPKSKGPKEPEGDDDTDLGLRPPPDAGPAQPGEIPAPLRTAVERVLTLLDALGDAAEQHGGDCDAMGTEFQAIADGPDGGAIKEIDADPSWQEHGEAVAAEYGGKLDAASVRIRDGIGDCQMNKKVNDALTKIGV